MRLYPDDAIANAAALLSDTIAKYGYINDFSYQEQTAKVRALTTKMETNDSLQSAVEKVPGLQAWLQHLKMSNETFEQQYLQRVQETSGLPEDNASALRLPAADAWTELLRVINAYATITPGGVYDQLTGELSLLISLAICALHEKAGERQTRKSVHKPLPIAAYTCRFRLTGFFVFV